MTTGTTHLQSHLSNILPPVTTPHFAGIIGDQPSRYAKSPSIWNPAFRALGIEAMYVPFDVPAGNLEELVAALREDEGFLGGSVTVPHKVAILDLLDDVDPIARMIGAVNTIARRPDGRLKGYNTDGQGAVDSLIKPLSGQAFLHRLTGATVLLIGAGGAGRAVGFFLARGIAGGRLMIVNRSPERAGDLAEQVRAAYGNAEALPEGAIDEVASSCDLVVNATIKGQAGIRSVPGGAICLEAYSALAPANPTLVALPMDAEQEFYRIWFEQSREDIAHNHARSLSVMERFRGTAFFDLVYAPLETVTLRHARWSGHRTLNGKWMNIAQAADALVYKVCRQLLEPSGDLDDVYSNVIRIMASVW